MHLKILHLKVDIFSMINFENVLKSAFKKKTMYYYTVHSKRWVIFMSPTTHFVAESPVFVWFSLGKYLATKMPLDTNSVWKKHWAVWPKSASMNLPMRILWGFTKGDQQLLYYILALNLHGNTLHYKKLNDVIRILN